MNSRKFENLKLRADYHSDNPDCEIARYFPGFGRDVLVPIGANTQKVAISAKYTPACDVHHIFTNPRWDRLWNMISLCRYTHMFCHQHKTDGATLCIYRKLEKQEWDWKEASKTLRFNVRGWLSLREPNFAWTRLYWKSVIESKEAA